MIFSFQSWHFGGMTFSFDNSTIQLHSQPHTLGFFSWMTYSHLANQQLRGSSWLCYYLADLQPRHWKWEWNWSIKCVEWSYGMVVTQQASATKITMHLLQYAYDSHTFPKWLAHFKQSVVEHSQIQAPNLICFRVSVTKSNGWSQLSSV